MATVAASELSTELEALLLRRLKHEWVQINWALFGDAMRAPVFELSDSTALLGQWRPATRTIALSREAVCTRPWVETLETLKHEVAHQFVHEVLGTNEAPHGPMFRRVCQARGIDGRATHVASNTDDADDTPSRVVARVQKLLALAQSSNQHEAELAASTAQRIMLKYNLDVQRGDASAAADCSQLWLGEPTGRVQGYQRQLAVLLIEHFFVEAIWVPVYRPLEGKRGSVLEICGRPENLTMAEYVHAFVLGAIARLWREHKRAAGIRSDRDRLTFMAGAVVGFADTLKVKQSEAQREGLVWVGDAAVTEFFGRRHPRTTSTSRTMRGNRDAYHEGQSAGRSLVLSRPVADKPSGRARKALRSAR